VPKKFILAWWFAAAAAGVFAQTAPQKVGVIQIQSAMVSTKDGQKAVQDLNTRLQPRKAALDQKAAEIRELQNRLQRGGVAMSETAKQDLTRQIDAKTKNYNREMQDAQDEYEQENRKLLQELSGRMTSVIDQYAADHGFAVILDVSNPNTPVMYVSNTVDVTRDIIDLYDKMITVPNAPAGNAAETKPASPPKPTAPAAAPAPKKQP
jgi:outer membrane protein